MLPYGSRGVRGGEKKKGGEYDIKLTDVDISSTMAQPDNDELLRWYSFSLLSPPSPSQTFLIHPHHTTLVLKIAHPFITIHNSNFYIQPRHSNLIPY